MALRLRPTHFLALPLSDHASLRKLVSEYQNALMNQEPAIAGLDQRIAIDPRRLHFTLGVMSLKDETQVTAALELLHSIKEEIALVLEGHKSVTAQLDRLGVFNIQQEKSANVLYVGPSRTALESENGRRLVRVSELVRQKFIDAGYITEKRALELHCTILNTSHRRPRGQGFDFSNMRIGTGTDFGAYDISEIGLWRMGSHSRVDNSYVSVGSIAF